MSLFNVSGRLSSVINPSTLLITLLATRHLCNNGNTSYSRGNTTRGHVNN